MSKNIHKSIESMELNEALSTVFLTAYKCSGGDAIGELSTLPYVMDKSTLFRFLKIYGGRTITVPTVSEFLYYVKLLMIWDLIMQNKMDIQTACKKVGIIYSEKIELELDNIQHIMESFDA